MKLLAVHVGKPREVQWNGNSVSTGIFKEPVSSPLRVSKLNLEGDGQADLRVHGGEHKAVYSYTRENYEWWRRELGRTDLAFGTFGENLTFEGYDESAVCVGDQIQIGSVIFEAAQQRMPCFKLGIRMGDDSFVKRFQNAARWGVYWRVVQEGTLEAGQEIKILKTGVTEVRIYELPDLLFEDGPSDAEKLTSLLALPTLAPNIRRRL